MNSVYLSFVIPVFNEAGNIPLIVRDLVEIKQKYKDVEAVFVDDGSTDSSKQLFREMEKKYAWLRVLELNRRAGKTVALQRGFEEAKGELIVMLDGDCQYDVSDLPKFIAKIEEGYDFVNGCRVDRADSLFKKIPSRFYNALSNILFGLKIRDANSGFKVIKKSILKDVSMEHDDHRYMLVLAKRAGYRIAEVPVTHKPRAHGHSKYGSLRLLWGPIDLVGLRLELFTMDKPVRLFGGLGTILFLTGLIAGLYLVNLRLQGQTVSEHLPMLSLTIVLLISGIQLFSFGLILNAIKRMR